MASETKKLLCTSKDFDWKALFNQMPVPAAKNSEDITRKLDNEFEILWENAAESFVEKSGTTGYLMPADSIKNLSDEDKQELHKQCESYIALTNDLLKQNPNYFAVSLDDK